MSGSEVARLLRERAESYGRDARSLADEGDDRFPLIYRAVADELRRVAVALESAGCNVAGHKVFVTLRKGVPVIEMVNDDEPLERMTLELLPEEAQEIAGWLNDAADEAALAEALREFE